MLLRIRLRSALMVFAEPLFFFQDTFNGSASNEPFFTSVASITVQVKDMDNRPPWFQPCQRISFGAAKLCVSSGYRGRVNLTEKEVKLRCLRTFHKKISVVCVCFHNKN